MSFNFIAILFTNIILNSVERILESSKTSVAPPKRSARLSTSSFLPPAPTVSSSRARINREPMITATREGISDEDEDDEDETGGGDGGDDIDEEEEEEIIPALQFGPWKGHQVTSCSHDHSVQGNIFYFRFQFIRYLLSILGIHSKSVTRCDPSVNGNFKFDFTSLYIYYTF